MSGDTSTCLFEESGPVVRFTPERRTIISSVQLTLSESTATAKGRHTFALWAHIVPSDSVLSADGVYRTTRPVVLALLSVDVPDRPTPCVSLSAPVSRLELTAGTTLSLTLMNATVPTAAVEQRLAEHALRQRKRVRGRAGAAVQRTSRAPEDLHAQDAGCPEFLSVTVRLAGLAVGPPLPLALSMCDWRPLLVRRWLVCAVAKSTVVQPPPEKADELGMVRPTDQPRDWWRPVLGTVMEAAALSIDGKLVRWCSGAVGLAKEFTPYARFYTSARAEKTIRVRRHPHRHADIVGEIPFGVVVEALGQATDPFTLEVYVLLYLPAETLADADRLVADYGLRSAGDGRCVWGWCKVAGRSGLALLEEVGAGEVPVDATARGPALGLRGPRHARAHEELANTTPLPPGSLFGCAEGKRRACIRERPSTRGPVTGTLEANEVKEAIALVEVADRANHREPAGADDVAESSQFVQWATGGFSLFSNKEDIFLAPIEVEVFSPTVAVREVAPPHRSSPTASFSLPSAGAPLMESVVEQSGIRN